MKLKTIRPYGLLLILIVCCTACGRSPDGVAGTDNGQMPQQRDLSYDIYDDLVSVTDGPNDTHQAALDIRLYVPENASAENPQPALLVTHGFGNNKLSTEITSTADYFARNGYIVLTYTSQGFGASSGCIRLNSFDYDVKNSMGLISNVLEDPSYSVGGVAIAPLVEQDEIGAKIGLIGGSYGGGITLNVAVSDPRVRAIVPGRTWNSLQYALLPNNRIHPDDDTGFNHQLADQGVFKFEWTSLLFALGNAQPAMGNGSCPQEKAESGEANEVGGIACPGFPQALCETYAALALTGTAGDTDRALIANSSIATKIDQLTTPTLLTQGQTDTIFNLNDATATYLRLKANDVPVAMLWHYSGHGGYNPKPGECEPYGGAVADIPDGCYIPLRALAWFERWVRGNTAINTGPEFAWYQDWLPYDGSPSAASQYGQADAFPLPNRQRFYLSGSDTLVTDVNQVVAGSATMLNPLGGTPSSYTETSNFTSPEASPSFANVPPSDPAEQAVFFTSAAFPSAVESVGIPTAHLNLAHSNGQDLVFFGKVYDVAPDGSSELIHRLIAPVRVPADEVGQAVDIKLLGFAHRFEAGHRVRLSLATTDQTSYNAKLADVITVTSGGTDPAYFELPIQ